MGLHATEGRTLIRRPQARWFAWGLAACLLAVPLTLALPGSAKVAYAAPLEDCDADGFDDATGVAVPWPGFDETHGDTPAGPGTATWWIEQNKKPGTGDGGSSGSGGSGADGSGDAGGSTGSGPGGGGSTSSGSGKSGSAATRGAAGSGAKVTVTAPQASPAAGSSGATTGAPPSVAATVAAESSGSAPVGGTSAERGPDGGSGLWEALTVGFTGANKELFAGLGLLGALAAAGALALVRGSLRSGSRVGSG